MKNAVFCTFRISYYICVCYIACKIGRHTLQKRIDDVKERRQRQAEESLKKIYKVEKCDETVTLLFSQFKESFKSFYYYLLNKDAMDLRVHKIGSSPDQHPHHYCLPGHTPDIQHQNCYYCYQLQKRNSSPNISVPSPMLAGVALHRWFLQVETVCSNLNSFVKFIPGFTGLLSSDAALLLKSGREEVLGILG